MNFCELPATQNPRKWRFIWESHSHIPILRLYLFNPAIAPSSQCMDVSANIFFHKSLLEVSWLEINQVGSPKTASVRVPVPKVLIDVDSPINSRALDDHIEVKLVLLLPVDHPIVSNFDLVDGNDNASDDDEFQPLQLDSDRKKLCSLEEVHFYCRGCSTKLTKALRYFEEMPSVDWREAADNWFGTCCCSFGGVSEKLVTKYANSYTCSSGVCLLNTTSVVLCKDDLVGYKFPSHTNKDGEVSQVLECNNSLLMLKRLQLTEDVDRASGCFVNTKNDSKNHDIECCNVHVNEEQKPRTSEFLANKTSFLNGLLGNSFMAKSSYLSKDIKWCEISCLKCSCLLGAYPHDSLDADYGVHLFKCFISTCLPVGGSTDLFRKYTLERMFTSQLLESAKDELSFRTVVRNLQTRSPMLQIVLLNPNSWCSSGDCIDTTVPIPKINMYPTVKVLFSNCNNSTDSQLRKLEEWVAKNQVDDVYMLTAKELTESLELANCMLPPSHAYLQGLSLSFLRR